MSDFPATDADDIELRKRARRRLVGASALALLAVVVLPLVLNREVPRTVPDVQVSIPDQDRAVADVDSSRVDIEPDAVAPPAHTPPVQPPVQPSPTHVQPPPAHVQPVQPPSVRVQPPPAPVQPPPAPTHIQPPPVQTPVQPAPPVNSPGQAQETEATRVLALLGDTGSGRAHDRVFVQVGAFSDSIRGVAQAEELKRQGFAAYAEKKGNMTRVRIGPLPKDDAQKVVARLKAKGRKAVISSR